MTTLTVNIESDKDLSTLTEFLNQAGLTYNVDDDVIDEALEAALNEAEEDSKAGRVRDHKTVWAEIEARYKL